MGSEVDDAYLATRTPYGFTPRPAGRRSLLAKARFAGLILAVTLPCAFVAVLWSLLLVPTLATSVDAHFNRVPFEPGRWETEGGEYWVELDEEGQGSMQLPGDVTSDKCVAEKLEGELTYRLWPTNGDGYPSVYVELATHGGAPCSLGPILNGGGWGTGVTTGTTSITTWATPTLSTSSCTGSTRSSTPRSAPPAVERTRLAEQPLDETACA